MNIKHLLTIATTASTLFAASDAYAEPISPKDKNVAQLFSPEVQNEFTLLADTDDASLVYYVPRTGGVRVKSPLSEDPRPSFNVTAREARFGLMAQLFPGEEFVHVGGVMSTTANLGALTKLHDEANIQGLSVAPAPAASGTVKFLAYGVESSNGRIDVQCVEEVDEDIVIGGEALSMPKCFLKSAPDAPYDIDTNAIYKLNSTRVGRNGTVARDIRFKSVLFPTVRNSVEDTMMEGGAWDDVLGAQMEWTITAQRKTHQARINIYWERLFEQASAFAAIHNNACLDIELGYFFDKIVDCDDERECGLFVTYRQDDGTWTDKAPSNDDFIAVVSEVENELRDELFNEILPKSKLGDVSRRVNAQYTLRANYEKRILKRNETITVRYNPGKEDVTAETDLGIDCLIGGFGARVSWDMESAGCTELLGQ